MCWLRRARSAGDNYLVCEKGINGRIELLSKLPAHKM